MITEKEFQEALKIVNEYIIQLNSKIIEKETNLSNFNKTKIIDWVENERRKLTKKDHNFTRLFNVLLTINNIDRLEFIEDVMKVDLSTYRNSSKNVHNLFHYLISESNKTKL
jgi:hypothetical protein